MCVDSSTVYLKDIQWAAVGSMIIFRVFGRECWTDQPQTIRNWETNLIQQRFDLKFCQLMLTIPFSVYNLALLVDLTGVGYTSSMEEISI